MNFLGLRNLFELEKKDLKSTAVIALSAAVFLLIFYFWWIKPQYQWHQKTTIQAVIDGKIYSSSSVNKVQVRTTFAQRSIIFRNLYAKWTASFIGDAPFLDIGDGRVLVLLKSGGNREALVETLINQPERFFETKVKELNELDEVSTHLEIPTLKAPFLVLFTDQFNKESVTLAHLDSPLLKDFDNLAVIVEKTKEPVTSSKLKNVLPWLDDPSFTKTLTSSMTMPKIPLSDGRTLRLIPSLLR